MIFKSPLISVGTGKLAGMVFTRGKNNSNVLRKLTVPTNPQTPAQTAVRASLAGLAGTWATVLTSLQRAGWEGYAAAVTFVNKLGDAVHLSGINVYTRANQFRQAATQPTDTALPRIDDAPAVNTLGSPPNLNAVVWDGVGFGIIGDIPIPEPGTTGNLALKFSAPQNASKRFFKGPFKTFGVIAFGAMDTVIDSTTAIAAIEAVTGPLVEGQSLFISASLLLDDGRASNPTVARIEVGATA